MGSGLEGGSVRKVLVGDQLIVLNLERDSYSIFSPDYTRKCIEASENLAASRIDAPCRGVSLNFWALSSADVSFNDVRTIWKAAVVLHAVHRCSRHQRMLGLKNLIESVRQQNTCRCSAEPETLIRCLNWACLVYVRKTKCLEWAVALILLGAQYGLTMRLVVGVQNRPFYAHAWVEMNGVIVGDDVDLRGKLSVILEV